MLLKDAERFGIPLNVIDILLSTGIKELYPPQVQAIKQGLFTTNKSFVIASPTASGKTLIAEIAFLKAILEEDSRAIYLVPLRALAREKYEEFRKKYSAKGIRISWSVGDYDRTDPFLGMADLIITTNEKMDSLMRHNVPWINEINLVIADEIHLLGDPWRGPTLEIVLTRLKAMSSRIQFIALSATIPNAGEIAEWLNAELVKSSWRPVPLREGVFFNGAAIFNDGSIIWIDEKSHNSAIDLAIDTIRGSGQALVFVNSRKSTEALARKTAQYTKSYLSQNDIQYLNILSKKIMELTPEPTKICNRLARVIKDGVAFHHAGILSTHRKVVEDAFRANKLKVIVATTTLAMGLNLPSRRVIIRDWWRYESRRGMEPIPVIEVKQMSGRAGRPGYDEYGEAIIIAKNKRDEKTLFEIYIKGEVEKIISHLGEESALRSHILAIIASGFVNTREGLIGFINEAFFAFQKGIKSVLPVVDNILEFLHREGMIVPVRTGLVATLFGKRISELYIDPWSGVILRDGLRKYEGEDPFILCHLISHTPDMMVLHIRQRDLDEMISTFYEYEPDLLIPEEERFPTDEILAEIKTASLLMKWIEEESEENITEHFGVGPGDIRTMVELSDWLLYAAAEIGKIFALKDVVKKTSKLRLRIAYGVKDELLDLVSLKGIGRIRARALYNHGYKSRRDIEKAPVEELSSIKGIGIAIAKDIKRQVQEG